MLKKDLLLILNQLCCFCANGDALFSGFFAKKLRITKRIEIRKLNYNIFTVTFDHFNTSLLNENINFIKKESD